MYDMNRVYCCCFVKYNRQRVHPYQKIKWRWSFGVQTWKLKIGCNFGVIGCKKAAFKLFPPIKGLWIMFSFVVYSDLTGFTMM